MKSNVIAGSLIATLLLSAALLFNINVSPLNYFTQKNIESLEKKQWEYEMLHDPATGLIPKGIRYKELSFLKNKAQPNYKKRGAAWRLRGPWNVGGRTRGMAIDVRDENHMIAGAVSGGLWQTKDGGNTWKKVSTPNAHPGVVSIAQDTRAGFENIWYALSGEISGTSASAPGAFYLGDGAFRSLDNGETWESLGSTANGNPNEFTTNYQGGWRVVTSPKDGSVYIATYGNIYSSADSGNSWRSALNGGNSYYSDVAVSDQGVVYATMSNGGFYRSQTGAGFTNITPSYLKNFNRSVLCIDPNNDSIVYFLSELETDSSGGVASSNYQGDPEYVSLQKYTYLNGSGRPANGGGQWENLSQNLPVTGGNQFDKFNCQGGYDLCIRVQKDNSNNIVIGGTNLYLSTDAFSSPNNTKQIGGYGVATVLPFFEIYPNHHPDQHDVIFSRNNPNVLYSISDGGVKKTDNFLANSVAWSDISLGYVTSQCYTVNIDEKNAGNNRMMVGLQDNGNFVTRTDNLKQNWVMPVNGDGAYGYISPDNDFLVTSIQLGRIVKIIVDERGNLVRRRRIDPADKVTSDYSFINPFAVDPNNENIMYLPIGRKLYRLDNLKEIEINNDYSKLQNSWVELTDSINTPNYTNNNNNIIQSKISCISISKSPANIVYLGTNNGDVWRIENAHSNAPIWTKTNTANFQQTGANVIDVAMDPDDANKAMMAYSNYGISSLFYTENGGKDWKFIGGDLESDTNFSNAAPSIRTLAILKKADGNKVYFAGTSIGLYSTLALDQDTTSMGSATKWAQESPESIGANVITDIKIRESDDFIAVATHGNGVFETYYSSLTQPPTAQIELLDKKTFPIPASNKLNYSFALNTDANITVGIYQANGQRLQQEQLGLHTNGQFNYQMDVSRLQNGMYFLAITDNISKITSTQKIIIYR